VRPREGRLEVTEDAGAIRFRNRRLEQGIADSRTLSGWVNACEREIPVRLRRVVPFELAETGE
jgi:hypothetical protein